MNLAPAVIIMIVSFFFIEETPIFLIRKGVKTTLKALNKIGNINKGQK